MCDCRLLALREYLSEANLNSTLTLCESPEHLTGRSWSRLHKEDFACKPSVQMIDPDVEGTAAVLFPVLGFDLVSHESTSSAQFQTFLLGS